MPAVQSSSSSRSSRRCAGRASSATRSFWPASPRSRGSWPACGVAGATGRRRCATNGKSLARRELFRSHPPCKNAVAGGPGPGMPPARNRLLDHLLLKTVCTAMTNKSILTAAVIWCGAIAVVTGQLQHPSLLRNHPAIKYDRTQANDPVAVLDRQLRSGEITLEAEGPAGYLKAVLGALKVPIESQVLVFSKTSFQAPRIGPHN